ncbi:MAG: response regulator [Spirochaetales bacterium]|nr:response regulator [Spirochaetales bacterium]
MKKILLVDDSTAIRNILKTALFGEFDVIEAENGQQALDRANSDSVDFFLLDVNMPVMDGISAAREIRKLSKYGSTPIVMLTTESRDERRQEGKAAGANGWVVKPCEPEKLLEVIKKMI